MKDKFPEIYKRKIDNVKSQVQKEFYYHSGEESPNVRQNKTASKGVDKMTLLKKVDSIFSSPNYVYQADVTIMYKNGENKQKKIVGIRDNYLVTLDNDRISVDDILDIK